MQSIFRRATYKLLETQSLTGSVIDLGGGKKADYHALIKGTFSVTSLNIAADTNPDILADLEEPLAIPDAQYDGAILMNVLEHVFNYQQLLSGTFRVLKNGGDVIAVVPFLFPIHPSPNDFHRFTEQALKRMFENTGFTSVKISPIAAGIFKVRHLMISRHLPGAISAIIEAPTAWLAETFDELLAKMSMKIGKGYVASHYPLGYLITAKKQ